MNARRVLVVIGPSASGKSSLVRELHRRRVIRVLPTWTTRPRRADERDGSLEHRFVSDERFGERARLRLLLRGCAPAELAARLDGHRTEIEAGRRVADRVIVNDRPLAELAGAVAAAIRDDLPAPTFRGGLAS